MTCTKHSKKRDAILACVCSTKAHPTAEWVYQQLKPEIPALSLGTVYRNLAAFKKEGTLNSVGVVDGMERYDAKLTPHVHFVCRQCKAVIDVEELKVPMELAELVHCGAVQDCSLSFTGICNQCVASNAE